MTDDLVKRLRGGIVQRVDSARAADRIEELQDIIARIQYTNLRRDMNLAERTKEIDKLCKGEKHGSEMAED